MFQHYDLSTLAKLSAERDTEGLAEFAKKTGAPTEYAIFFQLDQGSTMRPAGIPIESRFYLLGNPVIAQGLFRYCGASGLDAPVRFCVSQRDGEDTRIDIDLPSSFFSQFPELRESTVPARPGRDGRAPGEGRGFKLQSVTTGCSSRNSVDSPVYCATL